MSYTLRQAAAASGKSKATLQRAIKSGRLSALRNEDSTYNIDPAELHRVFPSVSEPGPDTGSLKHSEPGYATMLERENALLREALDDLRRRLDAETGERRSAQEKLTALLDDRRLKHPWWRRLQRR